MQIKGIRMRRSQTHLFPNTSPPSTQWPFQHQLQDTSPIWTLAIFFLLWPKPITFLPWMTAITPYLFPLLPPINLFSTCQQKGSTLKCKIDGVTFAKTIQWPSFTFRKKSRIKSPSYQIMQGVTLVYLSEPHLPHPVLRTLCLATGASFLFFKQVRYTHLLRACTLLPPTMDPF